MPSPTHQKAIFQEIRNFLAGRALGATRDSAPLEEVMKCLFAQNKMLLNGGVDPNLSTEEFALARSCRDYFRQVQCGKNPVFSERDEILLDQLR